MKKLLLILFTLTSGYFYSQVHFQEGFEGGLPGTWATFAGTNGAGPVESWKVITPGLNSDSAMFIDYEDNGGTVGEDWLVTPLITLGAANNQLNFFIAQDFAGDFGSIYEIKVSTTSQTSHASFTSVQTWTESDFTDGSWIRQSVDLAAYNGQSVYIAFVFSQDDGDSWYIDSVKVESPSCLVPTGIMASNIANDSADVSWSGAGSNYEILYATFGGGSTTSLVTGTTYTIDGLTANTLVNYIVREICAVGDTSAWSGVQSFTTTCTPVVALPYSQNFDIDTNALLPCGWVSENLNVDNISWQIFDFISYGISTKSGSKFLGIGYNGTLAMNDWVITPEFALIGGQEYELSVSYNTSSIYPEDFAFYYGNGQASANLTNLITAYSSITTSDTWIDTVMKFTPSVSGNYAIGVHGTSIADQNYIGLDNFSLAMAPTTSVSKINSDLNITLYPNPNNGNFTIKNSSNESLTATITDVQGKIIKTINNINSNSITNVDMTYFNKGTYFVELANNNSIKTMKVSIN